MVQDLTHKIFAWRSHSNAKLVAFIVVVLAAVFATHLINRNAIKRQHNGQVKSCVIIQTLRDQTNAAQFLIYDTFLNVRRLQQKAIDSGRLEGIALKQARDARDRAQRVVDTSVITGPTDCEKVASNPDKYQPPSPIFIKRDNKQVKAARDSARKIIESARQAERDVSTD